MHPPRRHWAGRLLERVPGQESEQGPVQGLAKARVREMAMVRARGRARETEMVRARGQGQETGMVRAKGQGQAQGKAQAREPERREWNQRQGSAGNL